MRLKLVEGGSGEVRSLHAAGQDTVTAATVATGVPARRWPIISALGVAQILAWGLSYYLAAVLARPVVTETGWNLSWVVGGLSAGLVVAAAAPLMSVP